MIGKKMITALAVVLLLSGCSTTLKSNNPTHSVGMNAGHSEISPNISLDSAKKAFSEYINYRLWWYPNETDNQINFEAYIGKEIEAEVRIYESDPQSAYIHTTLGDWLAKIVYKDGFVYCDGFVRQEENIYPQGDYKKVDTLNIIVETPHKPNYGSSPRKNKMIQAVEKYVDFRCKDFAAGTDADLWKGVKVYIADFYEYEEVVSVWFVRQDGYAANMPVQLTEKNNEFETQGDKGTHIQDIKKEKDFNFQREIDDAVKQFECD
ncbi:hypothetical protein [Cohnella sp. 56]|uniref:hypothetical protein n=1 Tax=Cohnella sp. 56 TaxID=3113722 RepID=UPI0030E8BDC7